MSDLTKVVIVATVFCVAAMLLVPWSKKPQPVKAEIRFDPKAKDVGESTGKTVGDFAFGFLRGLAKSASENKRPEEGK